MTTTATREEREVLELENIVKELEELRGNKKSNKRFVLIIVDEKETRLFSHNLPYLNDVLWALAAGNSIVYNTLEQVTAQEKTK
jgi:hypothetical protein